MNKSALSHPKDFVHPHRPHGPLTADATEPAWNGYLLTVVCPCGVVCERWITHCDAELDLLLYRVGRTTRVQQFVQRRDQLDPGDDG